MTFTDIQTEFGGTNPISLDEYYSAASGIPSSGQISMNQFYGKSATWSRTLTVGHSGMGNGTNQTTGNGTGFNTTHWDVLSQSTFIGSPCGSLSPNALFDNGATIHNLHWFLELPLKASATLGFEFSLNGTHPNSGWNNLIMDDGMGGTVTLARTSFNFQNIAAGAAGNTVGIPTYPVTRWRLPYAIGNEAGSTSAVSALRLSYFRSGTGHNFPAPTGINNLTPPLLWTLNKQINITIN